MHQFEFTSAAQKALVKLQHDTRERIRERLVLACENPFYYFKRLKERPDCSLRVGNYRVIAFVDNQRILVTQIEKRETVY